MSNIEIEVSVEITVTDRDGDHVSVDCLDYNNRTGEIEITLDMEIPSGLQRELLSVLDDECITEESELRERLEAKKSVEEFINDLSSDEKLEALKYLLIGV